MDHFPFFNMQISPLMTADKDKGTAKCVCFDLSFTEGSVNATTPEKEFLGFQTDDCWSLVRDAYYGSLTLADFLCNCPLTIMILPSCALFGENKFSFLSTFLIATETLGFMAKILPQLWYTFLGKKLGNWIPNQSMF